MTYTPAGYDYPEGLGIIADTQWCSVANPQGDCTPESGLCKPMTFSSLATFKDLQNQINRIASKAGWSKIRVDGDIGPKTVKLGNKALQFIGASPKGPTCDAMARDADKTASQLKARADGFGVKAIVKAPTPAPRAPSVVPGVPGPVIKEAGFGAAMKSPLGIIGLLVGGYLLWKYTKKPAKKRRRKAKRYKRRTVTTWL